MPDARRVLLTGGTGFLGSHLAVALARRGDTVHVLARSDPDRPAAEKVERLLDWHGADPAVREAVRVVEGDLRRPDLGLSPDARRRLDAALDLVVHCASDTSFAERRRREVAAVNCDGLRRLVDAADAFGCPSLLLVSTAYVAGRRAGVCREELVEGAEFHNVYEETKCAGEQLAWARCGEAGIRLAVVRPSIVYGDSRTGRTLRFNALYYPIRAILFLKRLYEEDLRARGGRKASALGIRIDPDGTMTFPLRIAGRAGAGVDLIPVDYFVDACLAILDDAPGGGIFQVVSGRPAGIDAIARYTEAMFGLKGLRVCGGAEDAPGPRNALEALFDHCLDAYGPYLRDARTFDAARAGPILARRGIACPAFDEAMFRRCMRAAVDAGWRSPIDGTDPAADRGARADGRHPAAAHRTRADK